LLPAKRKQPFSPHASSFACSSGQTKVKRQRIKKKTPQPQQDPDCKIQCKVKPLFYVINYDSLKAKSKRGDQDMKLLTHPHDPVFGSVIADESHERLRSEKSQDTLCITQWMHRSLYRFLLTGSPATVVRHWYPQLKAIRPDLVSPTFFFFGQEFCGPRGRYDHAKQVMRTIYEGISNVGKLKLILRQAVVLTQFKVRMTRKVIQRIELEPSEEEKKRLDKAEAKLKKLTKGDFSFDKDTESNHACIADPPASSDPLDQILTGEKPGLQDGPATNPGLDPNHDGNKSVLEHLRQMYKTCYAIKEPLVCGYLQTFLRERNFVSGSPTPENHADPSRTHKIIFFAWRLRILRQVRDLLDREFEQHPYIFIDGKIGAAKRGDLIRTFRTSSKTQFALLSLSACSSGITLCEAEEIVFLDLDWDTAKLLQAEDRTRKIIDEDQVVHIWYLTLRHSIEERMWKKSACKRAIVKRFQSHS
jgi:hypothetical protein